MKVRDLLSYKSKWTKRFYARDENGITVNWSSRKAVKFCLVGAIGRCYKSDDYFIILEAVRASIVEDNVATWNDLPERTFADIRAVIEALDI